MFKKLLFGSIVGLFLASMALAAQADPIIIVDQGPNHQATGSLSYDGNGGPLNGNGITFDTIAGNGTPANAGNNGYLTCENTCTLNFTTGDNTGEGPTRWTFGDGGSITLNGTVVDQDGNTVASGTLLSSDFSDVPAVDASVTNHRLSFSGFGMNDVAQGLVDYFGLDSNASFRITHTDIVASGAIIGDNGSLDGDVDNADLNTTTTTGVPEPGVFGIFGLALLMVGGLIAVRRRTSDL